MIISSERSGHWVHLLVKGLTSAGCVRFESQEQALAQVRQVLHGCLQECSEMDRNVQGKIKSLSRNVMENSSEWSVLYSNYMNEEMIRRGFTSLTKRS